MPTLQKLETVSVNKVQKTPLCLSPAHPENPAEKSLCFPLMAAIRKVREPIVSGSQDVFSNSIKLYKL